MTSRDDVCCFPICSTRRSQRFAAPLCDRHAFDVFAEVQGAVDGVTSGASHFAARSETPEGARLPRPGFVYIAQCGDLIKIGYSATPRSRVKDLGGRMVHYERGARRDEKALHHRFGAHWEHGEYFRNEGALAEYVEQVRGRHARTPTHT